MPVRAPCSTVLAPAIWELSSHSPSICRISKNGVEDAFPDPEMHQLHEGLKADAKAMKQQMKAQAVRGSIVSGALISDILRIKYVVL